MTEQSENKEENDKDPDQSDEEMTGVNEITDAATREHWIWMNSLSRYTSSTES